MWDLVGNPEDRFSHNEAHLIGLLYPALVLGGKILFLIVIAHKLSVQYIASSFYTMQDFLACSHS